MEDKNLTNQQLEAEISSLQSKVKLYKIITSVSGGLAMLTIIIGLIPIGIILIIISLATELSLQSKSKKIKSLLSDNIIDSVLHEVFGNNLEYNPSKSIRPGSMSFPFSYNIHEGSDHIKAVYKGLNIELGDITLITETEYTDEHEMTQKNRFEEFKGQWLKCDFGKELVGQVYVSEWSNRKEHKKMKSNVDMDNEEFANRFCVRADNPQDAFYILTPHMMEYITQIANNCGGTFYMSFLRDGRINVAVKTNRDFFELGETSANTANLRQKYLDELKWFTDIVDTLHVEDSLYKKEVN